MMSSLPRFSFHSSLLLALAVLCSCSAPQDGFRLRIRFLDQQDGMAYLFRYADRSYELVDSAAVRGQEAVFRGTLPSAALYGVSMSPSDAAPVGLFLENSAMEAEVSLSKRTSSVSGSQEDALWREAERLYAKDSLDARRFIRLHPASQVGPYMVMRHLAWNMDSGTLEGLLRLLDPSGDGRLYQEQMTRLLRRKLDVEPGQMAPDFSLEDPEGAMVRLSDFRGGYLILDFWAGWCPDCRREMPFVLSAYRCLRDEGVKVLAVSLDRDRESWLAAIGKLAAGELVHVSDLKAWKSPLVETYALRWIPATFIISPEGRILKVSLDEEQFVRDVQDVFGIQVPQPSVQGANS